MIRKTNAEEHPAANEHQLWNWIWLFEEQGVFTLEVFYRDGNALRCILERAHGAECHTSGQVSRIYTPGLG